MMKISGAFVVGLFLLGGKGEHAEPRPVRPPGVEQSRMSDAIEEDPMARVPDHLRGRPSELYERVNDRIVQAPPSLLRLARSYPSVAAKGQVHRGRRITL